MRARATGILFLGRDRLSAMAAQEANRRLTLADVRVADVDSHVHYSWESLFPYMDERHAGTRKLIEFSSHPTTEIYSAFRATPPWGLRCGWRWTSAGSKRR